MHGVMRALIARWVALIAMLGLLALVIATSRIPCVPYGLWPTLQLVARHQSSRRPASRLVLEIDVGKHLPGGAADSEAGPI
jgi:hypothetical protein